MSAPTFDWRVEARVLGQKLWQVELGFRLDVGRGGDLDASTLAHVNVHAEELLRLGLHCELEALAEDAQVLVGVDASGVCHPAVVGVEDEIHPVLMV
eukprot:560914-Pleurochrysis_carterae.AAC.1